MVNNTYQGNMNSAPVNKRVLYFDLLNIFATIAVVYLHCNGIVHTYTKGMSWAASLIIEVIFYWAVPIFFMLTGAKTLNYRVKRIYHVCDSRVAACRCRFQPHETAVKAAILCWNYLLGFTLRIHISIFYINGSG